MSDEMKVKLAGHLFAALNEVLLSMNWMEIAQSRVAAEAAADEIRAAIKELGGVRHLVELGA